MTVVGWTSPYSDYSVTPFTEERKKALIERIRKRKYNFTHQMHSMLPNCIPFYDDKKVCILTKAEWDAMMNEAYADIRMGAKLIPMDILSKLKNDILYEKERFAEEGNHG